MPETDYDLCIIGGGINGAGIAREAAGRGLSVLLLEAGDLAQATSSASTKLIHGGLRYLEFLEFGMVRETLKEREVLLRLAPHLIRPQEFVLPHVPAHRPFWMIRLGLFLYDHLARRDTLPGSRGLDLRRDARGEPLRERLQRGFSYADCWTDDARLVVLNCLAAAERGAAILTRTRCTGIEAAGGRWIVHYRHDNAEQRATAARVVNAAGPWVRRLLDDNGMGGEAGAPGIRLVKGSHIVVPRAWQGDQAYLLQLADRRVVFAIPFEERYTLVGTTEVDYTGDPQDARISPEETRYLCAAWNEFFRAPIGPEDVLWSYSGVRSLIDEDEASSRTVTRDYLLYQHRGSAPLLSVFGGKLTSYRSLAVHALDILLKDRGGFRSDLEPLPGGDLPGADFEGFLQAQARRRPWLPAALLRRYARAYGTRMDILLDGAAGLDGLGEHYGDSLYHAEVEYLVKHEWAREAEDILWRRGKLGLAAAPDTIDRLSRALPSVLAQAGGRSAAEEAALYRTGEGR